MSGPKPLPSHHVEHLLSTRDQPDLFGDFLPDDYLDVTAARWRPSQVLASASGRMQEYGEDEWTDIAAEQHDWERRVVLHVSAGTLPDHEAAIELAEEQRRSIERWYFTCPPQLHSEVVDALLDDRGFRARYEALAPGTAEFIRLAVHANADRAAATS